MDLKAYRESRRVGAQAAARELKVNPATLWRWEKGITLPDRSSMTRIGEWSKGKVTPNDFYIANAVWREKNGK